MKIGLEISDGFESKALVRVKVKQWGSRFEAVEVMTIDQVETLELELSAMIQHLYKFRREYEGAE